MIVFKKKGLYETDYDEATDKNVLRRVKKREILHKLRIGCKIDDDVTLRDIFKIVDQYKVLKYFIAAYSWCGVIDELHAEALEPCQSLSEDKEPLDYLEVYWHGTKSKKYGLSLHYGFHGIGRVAEEKKKELGADEDGLVHYSISASPLWELVDLPVKLKEDFVLRDRDWETHNAG